MDQNESLVKPEFTYLCIAPIATMHSYTSLSPGNPGFWQIILHTIPIFSPFIPGWLKTTFEVTFRNHAWS